MHHSSLKFIIVILTVIIGLGGTSQLTAQNAPFITVWQSDSSGISADDQIVIPGEGTDYTIEWENVDDTSISGSKTASGEDTLTFPQAGTYRVEISGNFTRINFGIYGFNGDSDASKLLEVEQWGDIEWGTMNQAFMNAKNLTISATDAPDLSNVQSTGLMFYNARKLNTDLSHWDTSNILDMHSMFSDAISFNGDISTWNTSNVTNMSNMFDNAQVFNQDIGNWDVSNVERMVSMFIGADSFNVDISNWDVSSVTNMRAMFQGASSFNGDISGWNVSNVTQMGYMFFKAESFNSDISNWDVSNVTNMVNMFSDATSFNVDLGSWDISSSTGLSSFFNNSGLSSAKYDSTLISWSEKSVPSGLTLDAEGIYYCEAEAARQSLIDEDGWSINDAGLSFDCIDQEPFITIWRTDSTGATNDDQVWLPLEGEYNLYWEQVGDTTTNGSLSGSNETTITFPEAGTYRIELYGTFDRINFGAYPEQEGGDERKLLEIEQWGEIEWSTMRAAFYGASNLNISASDAPDLSNVVDMTRMFDGASSLNADLNNWDVSGIIEMSQLFDGATNFNGNISDWNTQNVVTMRGMFQLSTSFNQDIGSWNTSNVTDMSFMFYRAESFNQDISGWDVGSVANMNTMFYEATSFNQPIGNWDVINVADMSRMFQNANSFNQDIGGWSTGGAKDMSFMFYSADSFNQDISDWIVRNVENMKSMFERASSFNQNLGGWSILYMSSNERSPDTMEEIFYQSNLSTANYDSTLMGWLDEDLPSDIVVGAQGIYYCDATEARTTLINDFNWTINDAGTIDACPNAETVQISYNEGWNLLSLPFQVEDSSLSAIFPEANEEFYSFTGSYSEAEALKPGNGYWVQFDSSGTRQVSGEFVSALEIEVEEGWNLIAGPSDSVTALEISDPDWLLSASPMYTFSGSYQSSGALAPGKSYWIQADSGGTITLDTGVDISVLQKQESSGRWFAYSEEAAGIKENLNKLSVNTKGSSDKQKLYFGENPDHKKAKQLFQLPPKPPAGVFDVRFEDDENFKTLSEKASIRLTAGSDVEQVEITYTSTVDEMESYTLQSITKGGEILDSYTLKKDQATSITVSDEVMWFELTSNVSVGIGSESMPDEFVLKQNYPNPFNPETQISYSLPEAAEVRLAVYNILGQQVKNLVAEQQEAGRHTVTFDASDLSSGTYIYRLEAGSFVQTRQMMFVK
jgi:surface protein